MLNGQGCQPRHSIITASKNYGITLTMVEIGPRTLAFQEPFDAAETVNYALAARSILDNEEQEGSHAIFYRLDKLLKI